MENLYNPAAMSEQEIKNTFVARHGLVDRLVNMIQRQPEGAGVQHVVLVAPRGMGKTTLLLMMQFAITDRGLAPPWLAVPFPEELYGVNDLADFWLETLANVSRATGDADLPQAVERLKTRYPNSSQLQEAALALLRDWCRRNGRRLILLVDNFHMILSQINNEQENAALRHVLMNEGFLMIIGAAPTFFKEASRYDEPLYNFFQIERLERLTFEDIQSLLRQRAAADGLTDFETTLTANTTRLRVLQYFTGGNARLVLMLYRIITRSDVSEVRRDLELLLDQVTPYYKDKTEALPAQQRKILDHIARASGQTHEGVSPSEIAKAVRLTPQLVSAQLKRLVEQGYVQPANLRGRSTFYTLSEPLYSLWYQMRFGRDAHERMAWLVSFLRRWYDRAEIDTENRRLATQFQSLFDAGHLQEARSALEHQYLLAFATDDEWNRIHALSSVVRGYLNLNDKTALSEVLSSTGLEQLDPLIMGDLIRAGHVGQEIAVSHNMAVEQSRSVAIIGIEALRLHDLDKFLEATLQEIKLVPRWYGAWRANGIALRLLKRHDEALQSMNHALSLKPNDVGSLSERSQILLELGEPEKALDDLDQAILIDPEHWGAIHRRGVSLSKLGEHKKAITDFDKSLRLNPNHAQAWYDCGISYEAVNEYEKALANYDMAISLMPNNLTFVVRRLAPLGQLHRFDELLELLDHLEGIFFKLVFPNDTNSHSQAVRETMDTIKESSKIIRQCTSRAKAATFILPVFQFLKASAEAYNLGDLHTARARWQDAIASGIKANSMPQESKDSIENLPKWQERAIPFLVEIAQDGHPECARTLITESHMEDHFFPLARALDYLASGDEALIEKLTPVMRPIVEEVVAKMRSAQTTANEASSEVSPSN
jgi:tetratricopeptide (TPR) repeat protein